MFTEVPLTGIVQRLEKNGDSKANHEYDLPFP